MAQPLGESEDQDFLPPEHVLRRFCPPPSDLQPLSLETPTLEPSPVVPRIFPSRPPSQAARVGPAGDTHRASKPVSKARYPWAKRGSRTPGRALQGAGQATDPGRPSSSSESPYCNFSGACAPGGSLPAPRAQPLPSILSTSAPGLDLGQALPLPWTPALPSGLGSPTGQPQF